jgi:hypothetical protein
MFLYWIESERRYVHRKDDIPKGLPIDRVDVPTDTAGLLGYLNALVVNPIGLISPDQPPAVDDLPAREVHEVTEVFIDEKPIVEFRKPAMTAEAVLSRIDSPGVDVEGVVEAICKARGHALKRYAGAVAIRFHELEKI